jgi:general secretion pathway protein G
MRRFLVSGFKFQVWFSPYRHVTTKWAEELASVLNQKPETGDQKPSTGFTLLELIITVTVMAVLVFTTLPLAQNAVKRQREAQLRDALREMRLAIDEFKRDTLGACNAVNSVRPPGGGQGGGQGGRGNQPFAQTVPADPRSRVVIDEAECDSLNPRENPDLYPPSLELLVEGVRVKPRGLNIRQNSPFEDKGSLVFDDSESKEIKKVYLRKIPVDPMTGRDDTWRLRSSYQEAGSDSWDDINVFDVRSGSDEEALNGEKYSDW